MPFLEYNETLELMKGVNLNPMQKAFDGMFWEPWNQNRFQILIDMGDLWENIISSMRTW